MRFENQLKTFLRILNTYQDELPVAKFLPGFFRANRQMGSTDRRTASRLLYSYFRMGKASPNLPLEERLFIGEFLCSSTVNPFLEYFKPELHQKIGLSLPEKIRWLENGTYNFKLDDVFPFHQHLSEGIEKDEFIKSFFIQPDVFIRVHPGKEKLVKAKLAEEGIDFLEESGSALRLPAAVKLDQIFPNDRPFEVQDVSSQETGKYFEAEPGDYWWDCCAASGGKSLLLAHQQPDVKLLVSDIRQSVLKNLDERFAVAGLKNYQKKILDLTLDQEQVLHSFQFDGIIFDAPCSGSGTWGRTSEQVSRFPASKIADFQRLQRGIAKNIIPYLKMGKPLIYITCSVFKEENEENIEFFIKEFGLKLEKQEVIRGYAKKADTMFAARLIK